ncbi:MAG: hypothetical protein MZV64_16830 [Ignavibacteriales bacterium]|nr:hypothetical protein [Ignavibacteriales bacterium]
MTAKRGSACSPADLKGKKFRGVPDPGPGPRWYGGPGPSSTPVEVSELPTALMTGMVVGQGESRSPRSTPTSFMRFRPT